MTGERGRPTLTLGPVLYHWPAERLRDFYFRVAEEAPVDVVHLGEVVCAKRMPLVAPVWEEVARRLEAAGKTVVYSTLALASEPRDLELVHDVATPPGRLVEANDYSALSLIAGRPHVVGPFVNVYNEMTLAMLAGEGAIRVCLPVELPLSSIRVLAASGAAAIEVQIFGRMPLALSARCYHARSHGRSRDSCRYVCGQDPDGMPLETLDGVSFLAVNGIQTLSAAYLEASHLLPSLREAGVSFFRLQPQTVDMVAVAHIYRELLDGRLAPEEARARLVELCPGIVFADGYLRGGPGMADGACSACPAGEAAVPSRGGIGSPTGPRTSSMRERNSRR